MNRKRVALLLAACLVATCGVHPSSWETANMTPQSLRLQAVLATAKPTCFGRFLIDLPEGTTVVWGGGLELEIARGRAGELASLVKETEERLKKEPRYPASQHLNLYFETRDGALPGMKHVISQQDFASEDFLRVNTYFPLGDALVAVQSLVLADELEDALGRRHDLARRLRLRADDEIPTDPGQCIQSGFVADRPTAVDEEVRDFINVGFRLKEPPDVHLSIGIQSANEEWAKPGLAKRLKDSEHDALLSGRLNLYGALTTLRRAPRELPDWKDGFEFLTKTPDEDRSKAHHDFWMIVPGEIDKLYHPYVDIRMASGVSQNETGGVRPVWNDDETIALWDALTGSIRIRPVTTRGAVAVPEIALGTLVATGRPCPRTGLWRCAEGTADVQGGCEQFFRFGETMPSAHLFGKPSLRDRLRGEVPTHASPTVWKLVGTDAPTNGKTPR